MSKASAARNHECTHQRSGDRFAIILARGFPPRCRIAESPETQSIHAAPMRLGPMMCPTPQASKDDAADKMERKLSCAPWSAEASSENARAAPTHKRCAC